MNQTPTEIEILKYNSDIHHRHSMRLKGYNYSQTGAYFVTLVTKNRECLFGEIMDGEMQLNDVGEIAQNTWNNLINQSNIVLDEFIIMPNHIHGIIVIHHHDGRGLIYQTQDKTQTQDKKNLISEEKGLINQTPTKWILMQNSKQTLGKIIRYFKARTSKLLHDGGDSHFQWQRNYYEQIVRNENGVRLALLYYYGNDGTQK